MPGITAIKGDIDPRWQAIIDISVYIESNPKEIWDFVVRWGQHEDENIRNAISTCLLEHLLEYHFKQIFPKVEELVRKSRLFANTFCKCWKFGQSEEPENSIKIDQLKKEFCS
ncbi:hypothetical protein JW879_09680 [candidate division WOR-3 bacterium]|nr:hypothetical protein [candidate division WOR-3 bacterium]